MLRFLFIKVREMNVLITGANRGIGLGFVNHYLQQGASVWACYRSDNSSLKAFDHPNLTLIQWDVTSATPPHSELPESLDLLINNAGIYGPSKQAGQTLQKITTENMMQVFEVNCAAPIRVVQTLLPQLTKAQGTIANISSKMGSSSDNSSGSCYAYRAAKAALIISSKSMAIDLAPDHIKVITLHPGWVQTDMTNHTGEIDIATSVRGMSQVITQIADYPVGAFVAYDGIVIPF